METEDLMQDWLKMFRTLNGKRPCEGEKGKRGALAELERITDIDDKNLGVALDKAIQEAREGAMWAQLNKR